ncbi:MAG TPA: DNA polymerase III subunit delta [Gammaproteobacteria bacterium]|nr:DNA polymerase III subunit delta [Gammaproteobacteria bacterium]
MSLSPEQLEAGLARRLAPAYLIAGDEPLLIQECVDAIRRRAREQGFAEREVHAVERGFDWAAFAGELSSLSLFAARRVIELRLKTPAAADGGAELFARFAATPPDDILLLAIAPKLDRRAQQAPWVKAFAQAGELVVVRPVDPPALPSWIQGRLRKAGLSADAAAVRLIAERVEGNLLAAHQEIEKLRLLHGEGELDAEAVRAAVADSARFDIFKLADAAVAGDLARALRVLAGLRAEGLAIPQVLWPLAREIRGLVRVRWLMDQGLAAPAAMQRAGIWRNRTGLVSRAVARHDGRALRRLVRRVALVDRMSKGAPPGNAVPALPREGAVKAPARCDPWAELVDLVAALAGPGRRAA